MFVLLTDKLLFFVFKMSSRLLLALCISSSFVRIGAIFELSIDANLTLMVVVIDEQARLCDLVRKRARSSKCSRWIDLFRVCPVVTTFILLLEVDFAN